MKRQSISNVNSVNDCTQRVLEEWQKLPERIAKVPQYDFEKWNFKSPFCWQYREGYAPSFTSDTAEPDKLIENPLKESQQRATPVGNLPSLNI